MKQLGSAIAMIGLLTAATSFCPPADAEDAPTWLIEEKLDHAPADVITSGSVTEARHGWKFFSGAWEYVDGAMRGSQRESERRGAQAVCVMPCDDAVIEFETRLEGCRFVQFRLQDAIPEHICRVFIRPDRFSVQKDDHDHTGPDVAVPLGEAAYADKTSAWKKVRVETKGKRITVTIAGATLSGEHTLIAGRKHFFEFIVSGSAASFRNLRARPL